MNRPTPRGRTARMRSFAALVAAGLLLGACSFEEDPAASGGDGADSAFSIAIGIDLDTLDPAGQTTTTVQNVVDYMVEPLVKAKDGQIVGHLADTVETSPDGLTVDLTLRQGVTFHDGTPFNADAVVFNLKRITDPALRVPLGSPFETMQSVTATGDHSVRITLSKPAPIFLNALTITTAGMISPASVQAEGNTNENYQHPVGTGPYTFTSFTAGQSLTVTKFPGYWGEQPTLRDGGVPDRPRGRHPGEPAARRPGRHDHPAPGLRPAGAAEQPRGERGARRERPLDLHRARQQRRAALQPPGAPGAQLRGGQAGHRRQRAVRCGPGDGRPDVVRACSATARPAPTATTRNGPGRCSPRPAPRAPRSSC